MQQQAIICPACHNLNLPRARFCQQCGHDMILNNTGPRFWLTRVIKAGGQGAVFQGIDEAGLVVAVKEMLDSFTDPAERTEAVARFKAEAVTLQQLTHPRIPRVFASFNDEGRHYLVMEFIKGKDLEDLVEQDGALPEAQVLPWADDLCDVMAYLHGRGMIYRDMKPSNVMLEQPGGTLKVIDFGIAKVFQATSRGTQIGTPGYAPPEQYQGLATRASDIYALGATLHHLLSGRDPRDNPPFTFPRLSNVTPRTADAIARALEMRQEDRFQTIEEFRAALRPPAPSGRIVQPASPPTTAPATQPVPGPAAPRPAPTPPIPATQPKSPPAPAPPSTPPAPNPAASTRTKPAKPPTPPPAPPTAPPSPVVIANTPPIAPPSVSASTAPPTTATSVPPNPPAKRRGWGCVISVLLVLLLMGGGAWLVLPQLGLDFGVTTGPTATPRTYQAKLFVRDDLQLQIAADSDLDEINAAFYTALLTLAQEDCACDAEILDGSLTYQFGGEPKLIASEAGFATYQASLEAMILIPQ